MMRGLVALSIVFVLWSVLLYITSIPTELATVLAAVAIIVWFGLVGEEDDEEGSFS
jgi:hypothetical protein